MNPLVDIIPAAARRYVYAAYALVGVVLGALQTAGVTEVRGLDLATAWAVYGYLGAAFGVVAASNVALKDKD